MCEKKSHYETVMNQRTAVWMIITSLTRRVGESYWKNERFEAESRWGNYMCEKQKASYCIRNLTF